jgi:ArsR family transcriptional regulator, arsenate/arsenite/antimonite-responsive transcriptional repressor
MSTRKDIFDPTDIRLSELAKSIGHPARLAILKAIADKGGLVEGEIVSVPEMAPATVIQHMRELKKAGLITGRIFGKNCQYAIDSAKISEFRDLTEFLGRLPGVPSSDY